MQNVFDEVGSLDKRCYKEFHLSEDILMEHAAEGMASFIRNKFPLNSKIIIVCGSGNNGADGIALSRLLHKDFNVSLLQAKKAKSPMALLQTKRSQTLEIPYINAIEECDVIVDAFVGTGFNGEFDTASSTLLKSLNAMDSFKIACDIPSGINTQGHCAKETFVADITLTMGALKKSLFLDEAKDFVGEIQVVSLGLPRFMYEIPSNYKLLDFEDMQLPHRTQQDSHKGSFGHLSIACGEKSGAAIMSGLSALNFGAGLVTLVGYENEQLLHLPHSLMYAHTLPSTTTALACGMGLGEEFSDAELTKFLNNSLALIVDADLFHMSCIKEILKRDKLVLTPHPKEFSSLLKRLNLADISIQELQKERFKYVELFCKSYPNTVLLLKGANVIIGQKEKFFINPYGTAKLAKGGSGDVLSGLIGALLAQGYSVLNATISASLAHTKLAQNYTGADFSLTPDDLIQGIGNL